MANSIHPRIYFDDKRTFPNVCDITVLDVIKIHLCQSRKLAKLNFVHESVYRLFRKSSRWAFEFYFYMPLCLASTRARTRTESVAEVNYAISAYNLHQTREKCSINRFPWQYHECLRIVGRQSRECHRIQSGMVRNATEWADRNQTARTHLGSHHESKNHAPGQSGCHSDKHLVMQTVSGNYDRL